MNTREVTSNYRLNQWTQIIRECHGSGQTVSAWCNDHGINPTSYYYWLKCVCTAACGALSSLVTGNNNAIVAVDIPGNKTEIEAPSKEATSDIVLHFGTVTLELRNNVSPTLIENTLRALQNVR